MNDIVLQISREDAEHLLGIVGARRDQINGLVRDAKNMDQIVYLSKQYESLGNVMNQLTAQSTIL